jgi:GT2 family glycosyltransferase
MVAVLEQDSSYAAARAIVLTEPSNRSYWARAARSFKDLARGHGPLEGETTGVGCAAVAIRRELVLELRFDPFFVRTAEDVDFFGRLMAAGWRLYRCPAIAYRSGCRSLPELVKQQFGYGRGAARLAVKKAKVREAGGSISGRRSGMRPTASLGLILRRGRLDLLPFRFVSGAAFRAGMLLERASLRRAEKQQALAGKGLA